MLPQSAGMERGVESRLVPAAGFLLHEIRVGGIKNLGVLTKVASLWRLVAETVAQWIDHLDAGKPAAVFSMGGYVAVAAGTRSAGSGSAGDRHGTGTPCLARRTVGSPLGTPRTDQFLKMKPFAVTSRQ